MLLPQKNLAAQEAFTRACRDVAEGLQRLEELLAERPFLCLGPFVVMELLNSFHSAGPWKKAGWWQLKDFLCSSRNLGKIPILANIFQMGWFNHQPERKVFESKIRSTKGVEIESLKQMYLGLALDVSFR